MIKKEWSESLIDTYRSILQEIEDDDAEQRKFFDSTAILLSNFIRQHVTEEVQSYCKFFERFDVEPSSPLLILENEKKDIIHSKHFDVFL